MKNFISKIMILCILFSFLGTDAQAKRQKKQKDIPVTVEGIVKNAMGIEMVGVEVTVQESFIYTETDDDGHFTITVPKAGSILVFSEPYYENLQVVVKDGEFMNITMVEAEEMSNVDIYMPYYVTTKRANTAAVTTVSTATLDMSPTSSLASALSGKAPGLIIRDRVGAPGVDNAMMKVRGIRTLLDGGNNSFDKGSEYYPLILVDGFERDFTQLDAEEIESISVLKDAAATAVYGLRGANGVIMATTKKGQLNRRTIDLDISSGFVTPTRLPNFLGSYDYAKMHNEARINDGLSPMYTEEDLDKYRTQSSPLTHPDVDFYDEFLGKSAFQHKTTLSMSGGNRAVRYFVHLGYTLEKALVKRDDENPDFKTRNRYSRYNMRSNVDVNLAKWLVLNANIAGRIEDRRYPSGGMDGLFGILSTYPSNAFPLSFMGIEPDLNKEILMLGGNSLYKNNPLGYTSYNGYSDQTRRYYQVTATLNGDLGQFITPGLKFQFRYYMDGYNTYTVTKDRSFRVWEYKEDADGNPVYKSYGTESSLSTEGSYNVNRKNGLDAKLSYDRTFGKHGISAFLAYDHTRLEFRQGNYSDEKWQGFNARVNYSYDNRLFLDLVGNYSGSDKFFNTANKKEFYPAVSAAWVISEEKFMKKASWLDYLKLRASWGITGNDSYTYVDINSVAERYPARSRWWQYSGIQYFGTGLAYESVCIKEGRIPNFGIETEKAMMMNIGLEAEMFRHRLSLGVDFWKEKRDKIFNVSEGSLPTLIGMFDTRLPIMNDGKVDSQGFEVTLNWQDKVGDFTYGIGGYVDYYENKIIDMGEPLRAYENLVQTGDGVLVDYGLVALGLFKDWEDINNSPEQKFGSYQPGDIKYKDVNNDGIIDGNDITKISEGSFPRLNGALNLFFGYKGLDLTVVLQGSALRDTYLSNAAMRAFYQNQNVSEVALGRYQTFEDGSNNWETATYPRLTTVANDNNWRCSTYWMKDASYIRLKNVELGYNFPKRMLEKVNIYGLRIYAKAMNAAVLTGLDYFDPEDVASGISSYPFLKTFNFGVQVKF